MMKKLLYILLFIPIALFGQVSDFTVTDIHGNTHNLHSYLNEDKYVIVSFIDMWSITHQEIANDIIEGYISYGSNTMDVIFISMTLDSNEDDCAQFLNDYMQGDESYPIVSSQESIENTYFGDAQLPSVHIFYPWLGGNIHEHFEDAIFEIQNEWEVMPIYIFGCTDIQAFNYNEAADIEDGSCIPFIIGCLNEDYLEYDYYANTDDESYCINEIVLGCMDENAYNYDAQANTDYECIDEILGCTNPTAYNYNPDANTDDGSCEAVLEGCTDETAFNYNASANTDDGSCIYYGCTYSNMFNYDSQANTNDGSCIPVIEGCMEVSADNFVYPIGDSLVDINTANMDMCIYYGCTNYNYLEYNEGANVDDGSCLTFKIWGCTDSTAYNYTVDANTDESVCYYDEWVQSVQDDIMMEEVDHYTSYLYHTIVSLSNQVQNLQESLSSVIEAEEVVSDANSFDVLNPLSYNGEFETVHHDFTSNGNFVVPPSKTLLATHFSNNQGTSNAVFITVNNILGFKVNDGVGYASEKLCYPLVVGSGSVLSSNYEFGGVNIQGVFHGILINSSFETIHHDFSQGDYIVPNGKTLVASVFTKNVDEPYSIVTINEVDALKINGGVNYPVEQLCSPLIAGENDVLSSKESDGNLKGFFHGFLIDNSNYTYATDYELIDALNEGMDSLSTMSEEVALENDSISSQNAILTEENETLMAIEYNYDSLQYVTEYLYSQVFDLQQELLVPNIDVDMAIGWNMIGFSCPEDKSAEDALLSIVDEIIIFKDNNGSVYMPEFGFNGIGDLTPGHGYQLKVTDYILDFNICE